LYTATGPYAKPADDRANSTDLICELPSECLWHEGTRFDVAGGGVADVRIGNKDDADALVAAARADAATQSPKTFGDAFHGLELWEMLGLAKDPGGKIALYAHGPAAATAAGEMPFRVAYLYN